MHIHADYAYGRADLRYITARFIRIQNTPILQPGDEFGSYVCVSEQHPIFNFDLWSDVGDETEHEGAPDYLNDVQYAPLMTDFIATYFPSIYNYYLAE